MIPEHQRPNLTGLAPILLGVPWEAKMQDNLKSKWNTKLLPLLMEQDEVSLYDIVKLISTEYISAIKYLADFLDYFIYQPDNSLTQEQNDLVLRFIGTLINPYNFKEDSSKSIKAFHKFNIKENLSPENYIALHEVYWAKENLNKLFIEQDSTIYQFESCFAFGQNISPEISIPTFFLQEHFSYFEATCLLAGYKDALEMKELFEHDKEVFHYSYPDFKDCYNLLKTAKDAGVLPQELIPRATLQRYFSSRNIHVPGFINSGTAPNNVHPSIDPSHPHFAPELALAINVWEKKYLENCSKKNEAHSPAIKRILLEMGHTNHRLLERIASITNKKKLIIDKSHLNSKA